jgi:hypothetical protein
LSSSVARAIMWRSCGSACQPIDFVKTVLHNYVLAASLNETKGRRALRALQLQPKPLLRCCE